MPRLHHLGPALRYLRIVAERKQGEVARAAGITRAMLSDYERGVREPSLASLDRLLDALEIDLAGLDRALLVVAGGSEPSREAPGVPVPRPQMPFDLAGIVDEGEALPAEQRAAYEQIVGGFLAFLRSFHRAQKRAVDRARRGVGRRDGPA